MFNPDVLDWGAMLDLAVLLAWIWIYVRGVRLVHHLADRVTALEAFAHDVVEASRQRQRRVDDDPGVA